MQIILRAIGILLAFFGLVVVAITILALLNPEDAQLANDAAPFAAPPSSKLLLTQLAAAAGILVAGLWLSFRERSR